MANRRMVGVLVTFGVLAMMGLACSSKPVVPPVVPPTTTPITWAPGTKPPNIVRILTDDQDISSMAVMTKTQALLAARGVTFNNMTATLSLCCPSRATLLTGQYTHNHKVWDNGGNYGGFGHFDNQDNTLAPWLKADGYVTSHIGKYMNGYYGSQPTPPGWDRWFTVVDDGSLSNNYYSYTVSDQGVKKTYGTADSDYVTDVLTDKALASMDDMNATGQPFFLDFWPTAPHSGKGRTTTNDFGPYPGPQYEQSNPGAKAPRVSNYLPASGDPMPQPLQSMSKLFEAAQGGEASFPQLLDATYRDYLNTVLSIDDSVEKLVNKLTALGQLDNTVIMFTSDNGLMWGNHGLSNFKWEPYEESLRVPLIITGPGFPQGVSNNQPVSTLDIVPTILQISGAHAGRVMDGKSLLPYTGSDPNRALLIESTTFDPTQPLQFMGFQVQRFNGVRVGGFQYTEWFDGYVELYDLDRDPGEMQNLAQDPNQADNRALLSSAIAQLVACVGANCNLEVTGLTHPPVGLPDPTTTTTADPSSTTTTTADPSATTTTTTDPSATTTTTTDPSATTTTTSASGTGAARPAGSQPQAVTPAETGVALDGWCPAKTCTGPGI